MTRVLDSNLDIVDTSKKVKAQKNGYDTFAGISDIILSYIEMRKDDNYDDKKVLDKFKIICQSDYYMLINLMTGDRSSSLIDCYYLSEILKRDFDLYLKCDFFKIIDVFYNPLNAIFVYNLTANTFRSSNKKYYDVFGEPYFFGSKYIYVKNNMEYDIHGCIFVNAKVKNKLFHILVIYLHHRNYIYNIPQYIMVDDKDYEDYMKKLESTTENNNIQHLKCLEL